MRLVIAVVRRRRGSQSVKVSIILYCMTYSSCFSLLDTGEACHRCCKEKTGMSKCESINNTLLPDIFMLFLLIRYR